MFEQSPPPKKKEKISATHILTHFQVTRTVCKKNVILQILRLLDLRIGLLSIERIFIGLNVSRNAQYLDFIHIIIVFFSSFSVSGSTMISFSQTNFDQCFPPRYTAIILSFVSFALCILIDEMFVFMLPINLLFCSEILWKQWE